MGRGPRRRAGGLRECRHGAKLEDLARGDLQAGLVRPRRDLEDEERVGAEVEHAVLDAHLVEPQDVAEDPRERPLGVVAGRDEPAAAGRLGVRGGKGPAVELPVGRAGQRLERDERDGDHVLGQEGLEMGPQLRHEIARRVAPVRGVRVSRRLPVAGAGGSRHRKRQARIVSRREGEDVEGRAVAGGGPEHLDVAGRAGEREHVVRVDARRRSCEGLLQGGRRRRGRRLGEEPSGVDGGGDARVRDTRHEHGAGRDVEG